MSRLTVSRITLAGLLTVILTTTTHSQESPAIAPMPRVIPTVMSPHTFHLWWDQDDTAIAPMPRAKHQNRLEIELRFGSPNGLELKWQAEPAARLPVAPPLQPSCEKCEQPRLLFVPATPVSPVTPACPTPPATTVRPVAGHVPNDSMKQMATDAFNHLLQQSGAQKPAGLQPLQPLPVARVTPTPPPVATPLPAHAQIIFTTPTPAPMTVKPTHIGKWYRENGPVLFTVEIEANHIVVTGMMVAIEKGKTLKQEIVVTGDYHLSRDGTTLVGLITGVDVTFEGDFNEGHFNEFAEQLAKIRKEYVDQPFAFGTRVYGESMMIGNLRGLNADAKDNFVSQFFAGRYKNSNGKPFPAPKPMNAKREVTPAPQVVVAAPAQSATPELIPATSLQPVPTMPAPTMTPPALPVPQMMPPVAPNTN